MLLRLVTLLLMMLPCYAAVAAAKMPCRLLLPYRPAASHDAFAAAFFFAAIDLMLSRSALMRSVMRAYLMRVIDPRCAAALCAALRRDVLEAAACCHLQLFLRCRRSLLLLSTFCRCGARLYFLLLRARRIVKERRGLYVLRRATSRYCLFAAAPYAYVDICRAPPRLLYVPILC